ncbi:zinc finger protein 648 [Orussus abietinus]|uniref:zinc finger protein 648 n=1 Tax=Orussus abietinus TaxID=222816 RepID=UPI000C715F84|nr:zinc finger protein 648 [Orussus abietinus]
MSPFLSSVWSVKQEFPEEEDLIPEQFLRIETKNYLLTPSKEVPIVEKKTRANAVKKESIHRRIVCRACRKSFSRMDSLRRHEKHYCGGTNPNRNVCEWCGMKFTRSTILANHVKSMHFPKDSQQLHIADVGGQSELQYNSPSARARDLSATKAQDSRDESAPGIEEKVSPEDTFGVSFHTEASYLLGSPPVLYPTVEEKNLRYPQFSCTGCGRGYTRIDSLKRHQQKCDTLLSFRDEQQKTEILQLQYPCGRCGKTYKRLDTLRRHQRLVCGNKEEN